ncbi:hypothetical protein ACX8Z9_07300 [Arthrobacter halodurans]|uniref:Major facilitator superfamily (MFS) profile domain-containing protein n=1 Tax=Arthrobacter halodurans TaxID=516699 RepID=A0ABV4UMZ4_9MICC
MQPDPAGSALDGSALDRALRSRAWWGLLIVFGGWAALASPAFFALLTAHVGFTGCFIECARPQPVLGATAAALLAGMALAPVLGGAAFLRRSRALWGATAGCAVAVLAILVFANLAGIL